jgi:hypothetical protein
MTDFNADHKKITCQHHIGDFAENFYIVCLFTQFPSGLLDEPGANPILRHFALEQFTGNPERYLCHFECDVYHTRGIQFLQQAGNAYWLVNMIADYFGSKKMDEAMRRDPRLRSFQVWRLNVKNQSAVLVAQADADEEPFIRHEIEFTDFPLDHVEIWAGYDGSQWTLHLPSEH